MSINLGSILFNHFIDMQESSNKSNIANLTSKILKNKQKRHVLVLSILKGRKKPRKKVPKNKSFLKIIEKYPDDTFYSHFQMGRSTFQKLYEMLVPLWRSKASGRPGYSLKQCLYITLWKLCNKNSFREISDRFNISWSTAYRIFIKTVSVITELKRKIIKFPSSEESQKQTIKDFENARCHPFPFVLGCIDGMHIRISTPTKDAISYYNRKGTYSVLIQGVVDSKLRFIDAFVGYPGRCHDAEVWHNSPLKKAIVNKTVRFPPECHLLGDAAYPLETHLMVPYKDNGFLSADQRKFNTILSSTRVCVEQAFGVLKKKFQILNYLELQRLYLAKNIIMACIVLHNIIINNEGCDSLDTIESENNEHNTNLSATESGATNEAKRKRDRLKTLLSA